MSSFYATLNHSIRDWFSPKISTIKHHIKASELGDIPLKCSMKIVNTPFDENDLIIIDDGTTRRIKKVKAVWLELESFH